MWYHKAIKLSQNFVHRVIQFVYSIENRIAIVIIALVTYFSLKLVEWDYARLSRYLIQIKKAQILPEIVRRA